MVYKSLAYLTLAFTIFLSTWVTNSFASEEGENELSATRKRLIELPERQDGDLKVLKEEQTHVQPTTALIDLPTLVKYIPQVVEIHFNMVVFDFDSNELSGHMGTGFIFDAAEGVILTNRHVVPNNSRAKVSVKMEDGEEFSSEVEILGTSPGQQFGDYAFIRVKDLAGRFAQMHINADAIIHKQDPVAFMGNSSGHFSIESGFVNDPYSYKTHISHTGFQSFRVQLNHRGGASGSPVFNNKGDIIGILYAGDDSHAQIMNIWYAKHAYEQLKKTGAVITYTLEHALRPQSLRDLCDYRRATREQLEPLLTSHKGQMKRFLTVYPADKKSGGSKDELHYGDIIVRVNGEVIGLNSIRLGEMLSLNENVQLDVIRWGQWETFLQRRMVVKSLFMDHVKIFKHDFFSADSSYALKSNIKPKAPLFVQYKDQEGGLKKRVVFMITKVGFQPVHSFSEFISSICDDLYHRNRTSFLMETSSVDSKQLGTLFIDSPVWGTDIFVDHFDHKSHRWANIPIKQYVQLTN
jgi:S1-C subfamily serine protease